MGNNIEDDHADDHGGQTYPPKNVYVQLFILRYQKYTEVSFRLQGYGTGLAP